MSLLTELFGKRPDVPTVPKLDLGTEQQKAIAANQAALPGAEKLVGQANVFSRDQINQMLESVSPGYASMAARAGGVISDMISGKIPGDVSDAVQNSAAARSLGGGFAGSGMARNLVARDLGLTSLDLTQRGINSLQNWSRTMAAIYEPSMMSVSSMFISPMQQATFDVEERNLQLERDWLANQIAAMPDPTTSGMFNEIKGTVEKVIGMWGGGKMGGGGGGGMGNVNAGASYYRGMAGVGGADSFGSTNFGGSGLYDAPSGWSDQYGGLV